MPIKYLKKSPKTSSTDDNKTKDIVQKLLNDLEKSRESVIHEIENLNIPTYHNRPSSPTNLTLHQAIDINVPIGCGDVAVWPNDLIVGDQEGVVVVPNNIITDISTEVKFMTIYEDYVLKKVKKGSSIKGLYPLTNEDEKNNFEAWLSRRD